MTMTQAHMSPQTERIRAKLIEAAERAIAAAFDGELPDPENVARELYRVLGVEMQRADNLDFLLKRIGRPGRCRSVRCRKPIYWVHDANGKLKPFNHLGTVHHVDCVDRRRFDAAKRT